MCSFALVCACVTRVLNLHILTRNLILGTMTFHSKILSKEGSSDSCIKKQSNFVFPYEGIPERASLNKQRVCQHGRVRGNASFHVPFLHTQLSKDRSLLTIKLWALINFTSCHISFYSPKTPRTPPRSQVASQIPWLWETLSLLVLTLKGTRVPSRGSVCSWRPRIRAF